MIHHNHWKYYPNILCGKILKSVISLLKQSLKCMISDELHSNYKKITFPPPCSWKSLSYFHWNWHSKWSPFILCPGKHCRDAVSCTSPITECIQFIKIYKITSFSPILLRTEPSISMSLMLFAFSNKTNSNILVAIEDANSWGCKPDFFNSIKRELNFNQDCSFNLPFACGILIS